MSEHVTQLAQASHARSIDTLTIFMRNIAKDSWNVGRKPGEMLSANEYAREGLKAAGLWET